jgi:hypothetical protein
MLANKLAIAARPAIVESDVAALGSAELLLYSNQRGLAHSDLKCRAWLTSTQILFLIWIKLPTANHATYKIYLTVRGARRQIPQALDRRSKMGEAL